MTDNPGSPWHAWRVTEPSAIRLSELGRPRVGQECDLWGCDEVGAHWDWRGWRCERHVPLAAWERPPEITATTRERWTRYVSKSGEVLAR